ncbi:hypothetical protein EGJ27_24550 [Pseudomonas sp. v388]|uniref:hypothetical protein n=1 Tax=Pseudomonas sp. v388 TaxID=2479849 RepID=UPI000F79EDA7|nr:hypothetical protein [Pseudomonas sp. v388]RRV03671.1 hypothetical protein EGJ27_24550 [Pseudomonas sp. v388]
MSNSVQDLLDVMAQGTVTRGWGAVSVFGRAKLNRLLEQQFIDSFKDRKFLPGFMGTLFLDNAGQERAELEGVELGKPLLSFSTASLTNSRALLTMRMVAGQYNTLHQSSGGARLLSSRVSIAEQHGFTLEIDIDLSLVVGEVDRQGKVTLKLSEGLEFRCNLAGTDTATNQRLAGYFKEAFARLPPNRSVFELGRLNLRGYSALTPNYFRILTQAAPGAKIRGAANFGEGAVVVFIKLNGNEQPGHFPPAGDFPYLIPDDRDAAGADKYSASVILSSDMLAYLRPGDPDMLGNLLFPGANAFVESERHTPADLAIFGNISPTQTSVTLSPTFATIRAGQTQRFTLHDWQGRELQAARWTATGLENHGARAEGSISSGLYTAADPSALGRDTLRVVVTAEYVSDSITYTASALLLVVFDNMKTAPRMVLSSPGAQTPPTRLVATVLDGTDVTWALSGPEYGSLQVDAGQALFTPDARSCRKSLQVQQIKAHGSETQTASVLLVNGQQILHIEPAFKANVKRSATVQLRDDQAMLPGAARRWKLLGGEGSVDASGLFTAPAHGSTSTSIVGCEIVRNGVVFTTGYSVIELSELEPEPTWKELYRFVVRVPGGSEQDRVGQVVANGYQQLPVQIEIETTDVDGVHYPLSVTEVASLRLVDDVSKQQIDFVDTLLDGIPEGDDQKWRTNLVRNRFNLAIPMVAPQKAPTRRDPTIQDMFLHTRSSDKPAAFHATFQADNQAWWKSTDLGDYNETIVVTPTPIPFFTDGDYTPFKWVRVAGTSPVNADATDDDWFYLRLNTVDYWKLECRPQNLGAAVAFETLDFIPVDDSGQVSTSTIRWESEQLDETMFSWTGHVFCPAKQAPASKVQFDEDLQKVMDPGLLDVSTAAGNYTPGTLVISLHRFDDVPYVRANVPARAKLSRDLAVVLIDANGNPHKRRISFLPASDISDRNKLQHAGFTPPPVPPV